jgi:coenzyme PQQ precursor peptide PqqA
MVPADSKRCLTPSTNNGGHDMSWKSPRIVEIALGAEINSYACAEAKK